MKCFADSYRFGTLEVHGNLLPRFLMGTSPFTGAGYFWDKAYSYHQQFFQQPPNMTRLMVEAIHNGCSAFHVMAYPPIIKALEMAIERTSTEVYVAASVGFTDVRAEMEELRILSPKVVMTNGTFTDKNLSGLHRYLSILRERRPEALIGACTNTPGTTLERLADFPEIQVLMSPVNKNGSYMRPSQEASISGMEHARSRGKILIGMQTLAAGEIRPDDAFPYVRDRVDAVTVGITSSIEITETLRVARKVFY